MINSYVDKISVFFTDLLSSFSVPDFGIDLDSKIMELGLCLLVVLTVAFIIDKLLAGSILGKKYRIFVAPGVILHEAAHALFCLLTGARIKSVSLFDKEGGSVEHEQSKLPVLGPVLISLAPLAAGIIVIYFLSSKLGIRENELNLANFRLQELVEHFQKLVRSIDFSDYKNWIVLYLALSIVVTMTPSKQDLKNIAIPILVTSALIGGAIYFDFNFMSLNSLPIDRLLIILSPILILLILALFLSIIIYALSKIIKR